MLPPPVPPLLTRVKLGLFFYSCLNRSKSQSKITSSKSNCGNNNKSCCIDDDNCKSMSNYSTPLSTSLRQRNTLRQQDNDYNNNKYNDDSSCNDNNNDSDGILEQYSSPVDIRDQLYVQSYQTPLFASHSAIPDFNVIVPVGSTSNYHMKVNKAKSRLGLLNTSANASNISNDRSENNENNFNICNIKNASGQSQSVIFNSGRKSTIAQQSRQIQANIDYHSAYIDDIFSLKSSTPEPKNLCKEFENM